MPTKLKTCNFKTKTAKRAKTFNLHRLPQPTEQFFCTHMHRSKQVEDLIADFRGLPRNVSYSSTRPPIPIENLLVVLKEQYKLEEPSPERSLVENWADVFGKLAGRCNPLRIKDDHILIISVTNQTLRSELQFQKRAILKRIRKLDYCEDIDELIIRG